METYRIIISVYLGVRARMNVHKDNKMKTTYFENMRNKEKFFCKNLKDIQKIDGVDYLRVFRIGTQRECLVKLDSLRKIPEIK